MTNISNKDLSVPEGMQFLKFIWQTEDRLEEETDDRFPNLGEKAPVCMEQIGTALSLLDRMSSCWWVCNEGDHTIEYLYGRTGSYGRAALRLMRFGFYDESLMLSRSIGEIANLLFLFLSEPDSLQQWKMSTRRERRQKFAPIEVRKRLESIWGKPPIDQERYGLLSEQSVHVHPQTRPQAHNVLSMPVSGAILFQEAGFLLCLNELALSLAFTMISGSRLLDLDDHVNEHIIQSTRNLAEQIGGVTITEIDALYQQ